MLYQLVKDTVIARHDHEVAAQQTNPKALCHSERSEESMN